MKGVLSIQSHVTFGHAGNSCAVFPMQRMGLEVWPIHTVHFSNHTQYPEGWRGQVMPTEQIAEIFEGLVGLGVLQNVSAILTGYIGDASQCDVIADIVTRVKAENPECLYLCDPVMGSPEKGCVVSEGVAESLIHTLMPLADILVPNQFELTQFVGRPIATLKDAFELCQSARELGPDIVVAKHLHCMSETEFSMVMATGEGTYLAQRPHLTFERQPVGVGDLISAVFMAGLLTGRSPLAAFEHTHNAVYGVLKTTQALDEWELQTIAAQREFDVPTSQLRAQNIMETTS
ncbi:pyridoxal kinase PdxY [Pseudovibrio exalbescens]|uniref:pyridoxal kinase PdxY n=1 Tax=Pseudovibrio exalbescens TaxID=197461 RepID=UPI002366A76A|nr:pyridoxal kinase PdxY [Pseudovibrio exalbescens]MDD7911432.1 pyridoxal kinase PdxY [Pseudovibrio exalbescens]